MSTVDLGAIARELKEAQDHQRSVAPITARFPGFDRAAAAEVARLVHETRLRDGARPVGRKIGFTNRGLWPVYGVHEPSWGYVYDTTVTHWPGNRGRCRLAPMVEPRIEPEVVLHFRSAPPPGGDVSALLASIDWIAHGVEIVQSHFPGWKFQVADTIADDALHGCLLVGEPRPVEQLGGDLAGVLAGFRVSLSCDGRVLDRGRGANVLGSPLLAMAHLGEALARQPGAPPVEAGELVTTGTLTAALPVAAGQTWTTDFEGIALPGLSVTFE